CSGEGTPSGGDERLQLSRVRQREERAECGIGPDTGAGAGELGAATPDGVACSSYDAIVRGRTPPGPAALSLPLVELASAAQRLLQLGVRVRRCIRRNQAIRALPRLACGSLTRSSRSEVFLEESSTHWNEEADRVLFGGVVRRPGWRCARSAVESKRARA